MYIASEPGPPRRPRSYRTSEQDQPHWRRVRRPRRGSGPRLQAERQALQLQRDRRQRALRRAEELSNLSAAQVLSTARGARTMRAGAGECGAFGWGGGIWDVWVWGNRG